MDSLLFPPLTLGTCRLTIREGKKGYEVLDIARRRYVALTPEEWVRQHVVHMLHYTYRYPLELIRVEGAIEVDGLRRRCDIVVHQPAYTRPVLIVECKRPDVLLSQRTVDQVCRYNRALHVPYLFITNGLEHLILQVLDVEPYLSPLQRFPTWDMLCAVDAGR